MTGQKTTKPSVFIGSSSEGINIARALEAVLKDYADVTLWKNGVFGLNQGTLEALDKAADTFDFAVLVLTPDDVTKSRDTSINSPRDNVLFEAGLFMGRIGKDRTFIFYPNNKEMKMPSDFAGIGLANYEHPDSGERDLKAAVSAGCYEIINAIQRLGKVGKPIVVKKHSLTSTLNGLLRNVSAAMEVKQKDFLGEIAFHCREWQSMSKEWAQGKVVVRHNYEQLLASIYRSARESIFSTSIPQYQKTWTSAMGRSLIKIQEENADAKSTRVFIFDTSDDVTDEDEEIFDAHTRAKIEVLIYFDREDLTFLFPADVGTDWTIVDGGSAIGVTRQMGEIYEAQWYFNDQDQAARFFEFEQRLRAGSITIYQWRSRKKSSA